MNSTVEILLHKAKQPIIIRKQYLFDDRQPMTRLQAMRRLRLHNVLGIAGGTIEWSIRSIPIVRGYELSCISWREVLHLIRANFPQRQKQ